ncbi:MAG: c-type cytochrome [Verrucomicrobia bacterium]|nr:c-type cytochrome [Verrucomicrobiota bacterium]
MVSSILAAGVTEGMEPVIALAASSARDESAAGSVRAEAISLLSAAGQRDQLPFLQSLLGYEIPFEVQSAAISAMGELGSKDDAQMLLKRWNQLGPAVRRSLVAACIVKSDWSAALLDAANADPSILNSLTDSDRQRLLASSVVAVRERAAEVFAAAHTSPVAEQLEALQVADSLKGDTAHGRELFTSQCSMCHKVENVGRQVGPDLTSLTDRSFQAMLTAIVDPNAALEDKYVSYLVTTKAGENLLGSIASETGTSLTLMLTDGNERTVLRKDLQGILSTGKSLMPEGLGTAIEPQGIADVIAFIQQARPPHSKFPGNEPQLVAADSSGRIELLATKAYIYGPEIRFSTRYRQLENWLSERDEVAWQVDVPNDGSYTVEVEASCESEVPDNTFQIIAANDRIIANTPPTKNENDFRVRPIGTIKLSAGRQEIVMRAAAPIKRRLLDLRGVYLSSTPKQ